MTKCVIKEPEGNYIHSVLIPVNYTGQLHSMNFSVNKVVKSFIGTEFPDWYSDQLSEVQLSNDSEECVNLSAVRMKRIGEKWLVKLHEHLEYNPHIII